MFKVTRSQMAARVDADADFAQWYVEDVLKTQFPDRYWSLSAEGRREMVLNGRHYARHFGCVSNVDQARFITLMWLIGPDFYAKPGYREALAEDAPISARLVACMDMDRDHAVEAIRTTDTLNWWPDLVAARAAHQGGTP